MTTLPTGFYKNLVFKNSQVLYINSTGNGKHCLFYFQVAKSQLIYSYSKISTVLTMDNSTQANETVKLIPILYSDED